MKSEGLGLKLWIDLVTGSLAAPPAHTPPRTPPHQKQGEIKIPCHCAVALKAYKQMKFGKLLGPAEAGFSSSKKQQCRLNVYKVVF